MASPIGTNKLLDVLATSGKGVSFFYYHNTMVTYKQYQSKQRENKFFIQGEPEGPSQKSQQQKTNQHLGEGVADDSSWMEGQTVPFEGVEKG